MNILIVDDDFNITKTLVDILNVLGHQAEAASSGLEALERIEGASYDWLLTDVKMPGMNGVELIQAARILRPELQVVMMTAYTTADLVQEGLKAGAVAALNKPLDIPNLLDTFTATH